MLFGDEEETGEVEPASVPAAVNAVERSSPSRQTESSGAVFHPLAYRGVVAEWPVEWRERWGHRANALEETGLSWRDAETQAFVEVWHEVRGQQALQPEASTGVASSDAESN